MAVINPNVLHGWGAIGSINPKKTEKKRGSLAGLPPGNPNPTDPWYGLYNRLEDARAATKKPTITSVLSTSPEETARLAKEAENEKILTGLGVDKIIGKKRKLNPRYNPKTDSLGG